MFSASEYLFKIALGVFRDLSYLYIYTIRHYLTCSIIAAYNIEHYFTDFFYHFMSFIFYENPYQKNIRKLNNRQDYKKVGGSFKVLM